MRRSKGLLAVFGVAALIGRLVVTPVHALQPGPWPPVRLLPLQGHGNDRVDPAEWGSWILVYVQGACEPCVRLLAELEKSIPDRGLRRVAIVAGGMPENEALELRRIHPGLAAAAWVTDPGRKLFRRLELPGAPMLIGGRRAAVEWSASGVPLEGEALRSLLGAWLEQGESPPPTGPTPRPAHAPPSTGPGASGSTP